MSSSYIPLEIVAGILSRLPVKSLLRFRCVSTSLLRLIDSSNFINLHLSHSVQNNTGLSLILTDTLRSVGVVPYRLLALNFDSLVNNENNVPRVHPELTAKPTVRGSCNGLVLLSNGLSSCSLVLWNPSTRKFRELPSGFCKPIKALHGFGYDWVNDDYKVVSIIYPIYHDLRCLKECYEVQVYSLKSNSWHRVANPEPHYVDFSLLPLKSGKLAGGAIHWFEHAHRKIGRILAFDLMAEEFKSVPLPEYSATDYPFSVETFNGFLSMICMDSSSHSVGIWVMKDYGVKESWTKLISLAEEALPLRPLAYSNDCNEVLVYDKFNGHKLVWFSIEGKRTDKTVGIAGIHEVQDIETCFESLVPVNFGLV